MPPKGVFAFTACSVAFFVNTLLGATLGHFAGRKAKFFTKGMSKEAGMAVRTAVAAVAGGTAAALGGGKFANGAVSAGFAHLFNTESNRAFSVSEADVQDAYKSNGKPLMYQERVGEWKETLWDDVLDGVFTLVGGRPKTSVDLVKLGVPNIPKGWQVRSYTDWEMPVVDKTDYIKVYETDGSLLGSSLYGTYPTGNLKRAPDYSRATKIGSGKEFRYCDGVSGCSRAVLAW